MNLWKQYLKEREDVDVIETETGFATYRFRGADCYIKDIYVKPECRQKGAASEIADKISSIAKAAGIFILTGSVDGRANGADISRKVLIGYGMAPYRTEGNVTYYFKELA